MENILLVDDNQSTLDALEQIVIEKGYNCITTGTAEEALHQFLSSPADMVITDMKLPGISGLDLLKKIKEIDDTIPVIVVTAFGSVEKAVEAVKLGAFDFITKPFTVESIEIKIDKALRAKKLAQENKELALENEYLRSEFASDFSEIIGTSKGVMGVFNQIEKVADANSPVLILGESGTGKELVARAIHYNSHRRDKPFVRVNCAALAQTLLESELFGHEKGAFSGAIRRKPGRFEIAQEGTIFLDEIGDVPPEVQVKLLRVLQEKEFERVGGTETLKMKARLITATNKNLTELVRENKFREDLYYRLNVVPIYLPPLRERKEDIPLLVSHFIKKYSAEAKKQITGISDSALQMLVKYDFPGNVRELENIIERAIVMSGGNILTLKDFPESIVDGIVHDSKIKAQVGNEEVGLSYLVNDFEEKLIKKILKKNGGNISKTAKELKINRTTLRYKMEKYGLIGTDVK
jgi:DNA-binding NtrC family response regulator